MKTLIKLLVVFCFLSCKAQSPLYNADPELPAGTYYKDLSNDLDKFVGTWEWEVNNSSFTLVLQKIEHFSIGDNYYDVIIGEYQYVDNGSDIINTIPLLNNQTINKNNHNIFGSSILNKFHPLPCDDCATAERRVQLSFNDPQNTYRGTGLWLRHRVLNGVIQLDAMLYGQRTVKESTPLGVTGVPFGEYTLIKQ